MKNLIIMLFLAIGFCVLPSQVVGQAMGYWVEKYDPVTKQTTMYFVRKPLIPKVKPKYSPENSGTANTIPATEVPVYQAQRSSTVRRHVNAGRDPYTGRVWAEGGWSSETVKVTATSNSPNNQPQIVVHNNGNSWPRSGSGWPW